MHPVIKSQIIRFGLILGAISIGYTLIAYLVDIKLFVNYIFGILLLVAVLVITIMAVVQTRKKLGGYISFREAFTVYFLVAALSAVISAAFSTLLFNVIDPAAADTIKELQIEATYDMMEKFGAPSDQIDEAIAEMEDKNQFSPLVQLQGLMWSLLFSAIIALIVAAATKKNRPDYLPGDSLDADA